MTSADPPVTQRGRPFCLRVAFKGAWHEMSEVCSTRVHRPHLGRSACVQKTAAVMLGFPINGRTPCSRQGLAISGCMAWAPLRKHPVSWKPPCLKGQESPCPNGPMPIVANLELRRLPCAFERTLYTLKPIQPHVPTPNHPAASMVPASSCFLTKLYKSTSSKP